MDFEKLEKKSWFQDRGKNNFHPCLQDGFQLIELGHFTETNFIKFLTVVVVVVLDATEAACISKLLSLFSKLLRSSCSFMSCLLRSETEGAAAVFPVGLELPVWFWYISLPLDGAAVVSDSTLGISDVISRLVTLVLNVFEINLFFFSLGLVVSSDPPVWPPPPTEFPPPPGEVKPCWERL